jgi:hypothetical protein
MRAIRNSGLLSSVLVRTVRSSCIASCHLNKKLNNKIKVVISPLSEPLPNQIVYDSVLRRSAELCTWL